MHHSLTMRYLPERADWIHVFCPGLLVFPSFPIPRFSRFDQDRQISQTARLGQAGIKLFLPADEFIHAANGLESCFLEHTMSSPASTSSPHFGFLTIVREPSGYIGGFLTTNAWGRPLEFRLTSAVQPNKVQQILYGDALEPYLCSDLLGKTLLEKTTTEVQVIITDHPAALDLRCKTDLPVALYAAHQAEPTDSSVLSIAPNLSCHGQFPEDAERIRQWCAPLPSFDWGEPFTRIREAIAEARKMGVAQRAA